MLALTHQPFNGFFLGLDFGTSGARASIINDQHHEVWCASTPWRTAEHPALSWQHALIELLTPMPVQYKTNLLGIAVDGTSGTVLLVDQHLQPVTPVLQYNHPLSADPTAKLSWLKQHDLQHRGRHLMHQVDYINSQLLGALPASDINNALKTGFDPHEMCWRAGLYTHEDATLLPYIVQPGHRLGTLDTQFSERLGLNPHCQVYAGTTDSIAAFIATGEFEPGSAVTSLGSTLAIKLVSSHPIHATSHGVYSHKLGEFWLVGGASNSGGAVLRQYFSNAELQQLSSQIDPNQDSPYDYYPLLQSGERFPIADSSYPPRMTPRPAAPAAWLHGLLQGMARIEAQGYHLLHQLGAPFPTHVATCGGGSHNPIWTTLRERCLGVPIHTALHSEAAYGTATLAADNYVAGV